jgi:hypothetical protein
MFSITKGQNVIQTKKNFKCKRQSKYRQSKKKLRQIIHILNRGIKILTHFKNAQNAQKKKTTKKVRQNPKEAKN